MTTKKALLVIGLFFVLLALTLVVPARYVGVKSVKRQPLTLRSPEELAVLRGDKDRNGVPDWQDLLREEVSSTTLNASKEVIDLEAAKRRLDDPNNITASFSKNLYTANAYINKQGNLTTKEKEALATNIIKQEGAKLTFTTYEVADLNLTKTETDATRKAYGNNLGTVYKKAVSAKLTVDDITTMKKFNETKDISVLDTLTNKKILLESIIKDLLAISVPYSAASYHLLVVNSISQYKSLVENMAMVRDDPIRAALSFNAYEETLRTMSSSFVTMQNYFVIENITFTSNEPGFAIQTKYTR